MGLKRGRQGNLGLEVLSLVDMALQVPKPDLALEDRAGDAVEAIAEALSASVRTPTRLRGWRTQFAFQAVVVALDAVHFIKDEDAGSYYTDDQDGGPKPPDYRIVLHDGTQLLVEVRDIGPNTWKHKLPAKDLAAKQRYAEITGGRLMYALLWRGVGHWTLIDPSVYRAANKNWQVDFPQAAKANEMALLGDRALATEPPLNLTLFTDPDAEKREADPDGHEVAQITVLRAEVSGAGQILTDPDERRLAWFMMQHGPWLPARKEHRDVRGRVERLDITFQPHVPDKDAEEQLIRQGFALLGPLSAMYSARVQQATTTADGRVSALRHEPTPGVLKALVPHDYWRHEHRLKLWRFKLQPNPEQDDN